MFAGKVLCYTIGIVYTDKSDGIRRLPMKRKNKIQILSLGLALALSQAASAFAAGTVTVGQAPGETAQSSVAETSAAQKASETSAAQGTSGTATAQNGTSQAVSQTPGTSHTVTAGSGTTADRPSVLPSAGQTPVAGLDAIINLGPATQQTVSAADIKQPEVRSF